MELIRRDIDATVAGSEIYLTLASDSCDSWRERHAEQITRRQRMMRGRVRPHASVRYFPDRFLRNLELHRDVFKIPPTEPQLKIVEKSIRDLGAILLDSIDTEFGIAYHHSSDHSAIDHFRQEIELIMREKERFIERQEFQAAADARDREYGVRAQLDTILFHGR